MAMGAVVGGVSAEMAGGDFYNAMLYLEMRIIKWPIWQRSCNTIAMNAMHLFHGELYEMP